MRINNLFAFIASIACISVSYCENNSLNTSSRHEIIHRIPKIPRIPRIPVIPGVSGNSRDNTTSTTHGTNTNNTFVNAESSGCAPCIIPASLTRFGKPDFCEGRSPIAIRNAVGVGSTMEIGNALTSIFGMTLFGLIGLFLPQGDQDPLSRMLYAVLVWNGIGSMVYHGSGLSMFGSLDGIPMLILVCVGMNALYDEIVHEYASLTTKYKLKSFVSLITMLYLLVALMAEQYGKGSIAFRVIFVIPMAFFGFTMIFIYNAIDRLAPDISSAQHVAVKNLLIRGWVSGLGGGLFWILDLTICTQTNYFILFGHWIWHIGIAYFATCLVCVLNFLRGNNQDRTPVIEFHFLGIIPISYYLVDDVEQARALSYKRYYGTDTINNGNRSNSSRYNNPSNA